jgi:hypothetical protein
MSVDIYIIFSLLRLALAVLLSYYLVYHLNVDRVCSKFESEDYS